MRFGLKTLLVAVGVVGPILGIVYHMLTRRPEAFFVATTVISTLLPFVLAIGTVIWIAATGRPRLSMLACAQCQCELTSGALPEVCPDCQARLDRAQAVMLATNGLARRRLLAWSMGLVLVPALLQVSLAIFIPTRDPLALLSTQRLLEDRLPGAIDEPWVWRELVHRLNRNDISQAEAEEAIRQLVIYMKTKPPAGWRQPLPWQDDFVTGAINSKLISDALLFQFCDVYLNPQLVASVLGTVRQTQPSFTLRIEYGNPFSRRTLGIAPVVKVTEVLLDGTPLAIRRINESTGHWMAQCEGKFPPGDHELVIKAECGYVAPNSVAPSVKAKLPIAQWPGVRKHWTTELKIPLAVQPAQALVPAGQR